MSSKKGLLIVISGPSGVGKTTLRQKLLTQYPEMKYSVSVTTRRPRKSELNGHDYVFVCMKKFKKDIEKGCFAEWAEVGGNLYGTSKNFIENAISSGYDVLLDIDVQGASQLRKLYHENGVFIFISPPSIDTLRNRLNLRKTDSEQEIDARIMLAKKEIKERNNYNYVLVNRDLNKTLKDLSHIISSEKRNKMNRKNENRK
ncbi:guanylate kinase [bacterium]|nr:guanylate kinase [bacterium]